MSVPQSSGPSTSSVVLPARGTGDESFASGAVLGHEADVVRQEDAGKREKSGVGIDDSDVSDDELGARDDEISVIHTGIVSADRNICAADDEIGVIHTEFGSPERRIHPADTILWERPGASPTLWTGSGLFGGR